MDLNYWENYYNKTQIGTEQSPFAQFFVENIYKNGNILELGCGNGRDSIFFANNCIPVVGTDQCHNSIEKLNKLNNPFTTFEVADFTQLPDSPKFENIYSRFTIHSIEEDAEDRVINWASRTIGSGYFAIEVRSVNDPLCGHGELVGKNTWFTDHSRRFLDFNELKDKLINFGFDIVFEIESNGLAVYKGEDPVVIRIIASKK